MDYAHAQAKIVHRDLKPANILVTQDGVVKVADFGIARSLSDTHTRLTGRAGETSGTLVYMSPQQLSGEDPATSDDIYALGATLYELLTAKPPFHTGDIGLQIRETAPKPVNQRRAASGSAPVPAAWEETILACLAKEPEDRPQSAGEMVRRLSLTEAIGSDSGRAAIARAETLPCQVSETAPPKIHDIAPAPTGRSRPASGSEMVGSETGSHQDSKRGSRAALIAVLVPLAFSIFLIYLFRPKTESASSISSSKPETVAPATASKETKARDEGGDAGAQRDLGHTLQYGDDVPKNSFEAVNKYREAADQGDADAQDNLGLMYAKGDGVKRDDAEAVKWFRKAADQGNADAQNVLGVRFATGAGVTEDEAEAVKWHRKAAVQGNAASQTALGWMYAHGEGVTKNGKEASTWYRKAADQGFPNSQYNLGLLYANGEGVARDSSEAVKWYRKAADQGNAGAESALGLMYITGDGVAKDPVEAAKWFRKGADQGDAVAQSNLGTMYVTGDGIAKDIAEAIAWYRKSADQGNAFGQFKLGWMYENGEGVAKDPVEAARLSRKAAEQGHAMAQSNLGWRYVTGDGVAKDSAEAVCWTRKAADQGNAQAQCNLGWMYATGQGVNKDETEALAWYNIAATSGNDSAVKDRDALALHLGPERTLAAQQRSVALLKEIEAAKAHQVDPAMTNSSPLMSSSSGVDSR